MNEVIKKDVGWFISSGPSALRLRIAPVRPTAFLPDKDHHLCPEDESPGYFSSQLAVRPFSDRIDVSSFICHPEHMF